MHGIILQIKPSSFPNVTSGFERQGKCIIVALNVRKAGCPNIAVIAHRASPAEEARRFLDLWSWAVGSSALPLGRVWMEDAPPARGWEERRACLRRAVKSRGCQRCSAPPTPRPAACAVLPPSAPTYSLRPEAPGAPGEARTRRSAARVRVPKGRPSPTRSRCADPGSEGASQCVLVTV